VPLKILSREAGIELETGAEKFLGGGFPPSSEKLLGLRPLYTCKREKQSRFLDQRSRALCPAGGVLPVTFPVAARRSSLERPRFSALSVTPWHWVALLGTACHSLVKVADEAIARWRASDNVPSVGDIAKIVELASRLGRLSLGMASDRVEVSQDVRAAVHVDIHAALLRAYGEEQPEGELVVEATPSSRS
jgi:hypothetical protein